MKTFELRATSDQDLKRVVNREGEWDHYFHVPSGRYLRGVTAILHRAWGKPNLMSWAKNQLPGVVEQKLRYGGEKGDAVHQFIAKVLAGEECSRKTKIVSEDRIAERELKNDEWDAVLSFTRFWIAHEPRLIAHERSVANLRLGYAGSLDVILRLTKACNAKRDACQCKTLLGKILLLDWKSGGGIFSDMGPQIAAYANADLSSILRGHKIAGTGIIRLGTKHKSTGGYEAEFYSFQQTRRHFVEFRSALAIDDAEYQPFNPAAIYDIPDSVTFKVEREELTGANDGAATNAA